MPEAERERFDYDLLDDKDPFELDIKNRPHLLKHETFSEDDLWDIWTNDPVFLPATAEGDAHWLMVAEIAGDLLFAPLAPADSGNVTKARPIGLDRVKDPELLRRYYESR